MKHESSSFARTLEASEDRSRRAFADRDRSAASPPPAEEPAAPEAPAQTTAETPSAEAPGGDDATPQPADEAQAGAAPVSATEIARDRAAPSTKNNPSERRVGSQPELQGKGSPNPATPTLHPHSPATAGTPDPTVMIAQAGAATVPSAATPSQGPSADPTSVSRMHGGIDAGGKANPRAATAATPGFRTYSPQLLQAAEQARDSIFRQIVFRVSGDRSEMRVLLDPPELGQMDMNLVLDKAGVMQLSIQTERPELAVMLEKHMGELQRALSAQGIDIGSAQVGTRADQNASEQTASGGERSDGLDHEDLSDPETWIRQGYIAADGLDYWV